MSIRITYSNSLEDEVERTVDGISHELEGRAYKAANELRNAALEVLRGQRSGRQYRVPGSKRLYTASAPGEPPAVRTGIFRNSWRPASHCVFGSYISRIESDATTDNGRHNLGTILETGTSRMAPRPHQDRIKELALPEIVRIYEDNYD